MLRRILGNEEQEAGPNSIMIFINCTLRQILSGWLNHGGLNRMACSGRGGNMRY
jgi:hypothetical protein